MYHLSMEESWDILIELNHGTQDMWMAALGASASVEYDTGWRRHIGCLKSRVIFRKRATNNRALLRKMTCKEYETSYDIICERVMFTY